jgi:predicted outer membrane repeat protein
MRFWNYCEPTLINCTFIGNSAHGIGDAIAIRGGGGLFTNHLCTSTLVNCIFIGNYGRLGGGYQNDGRATLVNCTFVGNSATQGGGIYGGGSLFNCILWDNTPEQINGSIVATYCDVQSGWPGEGNIDADPRFVEPGYWDANSVWVDGDYHLMPGSPCIDAGDNSTVPADTTDLDGDGNTTEPIPWDLDKNPRIVDGNNDGNSVVDMGAYETVVPPMIEVPMKFTPQALNPDSKGNWVKAHFVLPEGFGVDDVDTNSPATVEPFGIESEYINVFVNEDGLVEIEAAFGRAAFCGAATDYGPVDVTVVGLLTTGQYFYGTDTIKIINKTFEYLGVLASHWLEAGCGAPDWCGGVDLDHNSLVDLVDFAMFDGCCIEVIRQ